MHELDLDAALATARLDGCLFLHGLGLTAVPLAAVLSLAPTLRRLDLSCNELAALPPELGALHALEELFLNGNAALAALPAALEGCVSLRRIDARGTALATLPPALSRLPALVDVALDGGALEPALARALRAGGTLALLGALARRDARAAALDALRRRLCLDVWKEAADTAAGRARLDELLAETDAAYPEDRDLRFVTANAARLFGPDLARADSRAAAARFAELHDDTERKALGADVELAMRAAYYDRAEPRAVERARAALVAALPTLDDARFFLRHARALLPRALSDLEPAAMPARVAALRARLAADRDAAVAALAAALAAHYPEREPEDVASLARAAAAGVPKADAVRALASDVAEFFPREFAAAKPRAIAAAFNEAQREKL